MKERRWDWEITLNWPPKTLRGWLMLFAFGLIIYALKNAL